jgi:hypothetical protein
VSKNVKVPRLRLSEWTVLSERSPNLFSGFHVTPAQQAFYITRKPSFDSWAAVP